MMYRLCSRWFGFLVAVLVALSCIPIDTVFARNSAADTFEMSILTQDTRKDTISVSTLDTAEGDVVLHLGVYIDSDTWDENDYIEAAAANWTSSDYSKVYFQNILDIANVGEQRTVTYSGGTYATRYAPYCFTSLVTLPSGSREMNRSVSVTTTKDSYDPTFGAEVYQAGVNQVSFSYTYYASAADKNADIADNSWTRMVTRECVCDVQYTESGMAYYEYTYIRQDTFETDSAIGYLPMYDPQMTVGEIVPGLSNFVMWLYKGSSEVSFFGESSDEFAFVTFDTVIKQGTPAGFYYVDFTPDSDKNYLKGVTSGTHQPSSANGLTIIVDDNAPRMTDEPAVTTTATASDSPENTTTITTTYDDDDDDDDPVTSTTRWNGPQLGSEETEPIATLPQLEPVFLENGCTMYVGDMRAVSIYNTGDASLAWVCSDPSLVCIDGTEGNTAYFTAVSPGTAVLYAIVSGKIYEYEITVLFDERQLLYGDVTCDGEVNLRDAVLLMKYMAWMVNLDYYAQRNADCNADGELGLTDALVLQQFLAHKLTSIPSDLG